MMAIERRTFSDLVELIELKISGLVELIELKTK